MSVETLRRWAKECDAFAETQRIIATTDPARYKAAMESARRHESAAEGYKIAAEKQEFLNKLIGEGDAT